jgi:hypothetical protein
MYSGLYTEYILSVPFSPSVHALSSWFIFLTGGIYKGERNTACTLGEWREGGKWWERGGGRGFKYSDSLMLPFNVKGERNINPVYMLCSFLHLK